MSAEAAQAVQIRGEPLRLLPQRALLRPRAATLLVADPHFGKDDHFRRAGLALPRGPALDDLQRLTSLIETHGVRRLVVLGDFVHARLARGDAFLHAFRLWREAHAALEIDVVAGNHDRREARARWGDALRWHERPLEDAPFLYAHEPRVQAGAYVLGGHLHPVVRLGAGRGLRVPVFWIRPRYAVLPAFGRLTGGAPIRPSAGDRVYAAAPERVLPLALP